MAKSKKELPQPPEHLSPSCRDWWTNLVDVFQFEGHHLRLLQLACEAWDRAAEARAVIARLGLTYLDRFDAPHARPEVAVERDSRIAFTRILRELALDVSPPVETPRPPKRGGQR